MTTVRSIGLLADTHSNKNDGSDLPDGVLTAFKGVDLIVHLGDIGRKGILDRLAAVAPVLVPVGGNKGYINHPDDGEGDAVRVVDAGRHKVGVWFNLAQPDKKIAIDETGITFDGDAAALVKKRFKEDVDVVAFAGTHRRLEQRHDGILFVNPGSPTLPMPDDKACVAIVRLDAAVPKVTFVTIT